MDVENHVAANKAELKVVSALNMQIPIGQPCSWDLDHAYNFWLSTRKTNWQAQSVDSYNILCYDGVQ